MRDAIPQHSTFNSQPARPTGPGRNVIIPGPTLSRTLAKRLRQKKRQAVEAELNYLESHQERMDYDATRRAGEPQGSGAMESTCRQYQCRFKRPGQFWSCAGDEALMCLETFWRNGRWHLLFPHSTHGDPSKN
jgi:hypothetical protein